MSFPNITKIFALIIFLLPSLSEAASPVEPARDERGNFIMDARGNCVRTKWVPDQCCDPCGFDKPEVKVKKKAPQPKYIITEKQVTFVDLVRQSIYFKIDKDNIDQQDEMRMEEVIKEINKSDGVKAVRLVGYADRFASDDYNIDLSRRRALNVLEYFRSRGYFNDNESVRFGFFGERRPVTNCPKTMPKKQQIECLQADRRVDIEAELLRNKIEKVRELVFVDEEGNIIRKVDDDELRGFEYDQPEGIEFEDISATESAVRDGN